MVAVREDFSGQNDKDKAALVLSIVWRSYRILSIISSTYAVS